MNAAARVRAVVLQLAAEPGEPADLPRRLVELCCRTLPVTGAGLTLMTSTDTPAGVVAASDGSAVVLEDLQFSLGEGPCVEASRTGRPVLVADLGGTDPVRGAGGRWPLFTPAALAAGVAAVFALPMRIGAIRVGVLDLYRDRAGALDDEDVAMALAFATAATGVLLHRLTQRTAGTPGDAGTSGPWELPLPHSRAVVHQATGMVSVTAGVGLADALVLLRAHAYAADRAVDLVASDVVAGRLRIGSDARTAPT